MRLKDKSALVIGAGSVGEGWGNGKACAVQYAREGASVVCFDLNGKAAEETAAFIRDEGGQAVAVDGDATSSDALKGAVETCLERFGSIDILLNNVGVVFMGNVVTLSEENWDRIFDINLKSCYLAMKHAIPHMEQQGGGSIVNISSISSLRYLNTSYVGYYTTKGALNHMTRVTAAEFAPKQVRVNAILPGLMDTPMARESAMRNRGIAPDAIGDAWKEKASRIPMGRMGTGWDIAHAAVFLASGESSFITGQCLVVDGGQTLCG
ncbi:SDR family NAD(P)-dependent oxidoreductase [Antarctobacter sp.]|uniref:SDR family NAD(P)-dependent oxidoreductase n=1 Tax=Antarctobacter sp. TaxID=1872577 RepID=UPI003A948FAE